MKNTLLLLAFIASVSLALPFAAQAAPVSDKDMALAKDTASGINAFTFDLYREIAGKEDANDDIFFSPLSISTALALAYEGSGGQTRQEMQSTMRYPKNAYMGFDAFLRIVRNTDKNSGTFTIANAAWSDNKITLRNEYINKIEKYYGSKVTKVNFKDAKQTANIINEWASKNTNGEIKEIVKADDVKTWSLSLTNATYFKARWEKEFPKEDTRKDLFYITQTEKKTVDFMNKTESTVYFETEKYKTVRLPYKGNIYSMVLVLPKKKYGLCEVERTMTSHRFSEILLKGERRKTILSIPKFTAECEYSMEDILAKMGMPLAFNEKLADFYGITKERKDALYISKVIHKAKVKVNEESTEAAAVTAVGMALKSAMPDKDIAEFRADNPFLYFIIDNRTNAILFMGRFAGEESDN